ncbi:MAG: hypothetical protein ACLR3E_01075 [Enterococcus durans]
MRREVVIVWLEDTIDSAYVKKKRMVEEKIKSKGYQVKFQEFLTLNSAQKFIENKQNRIDFFISDYNLGEDEIEGTTNTGLDYLVSLREKQRYKEFFILYSKQTEDEIQSAVIEKMASQGIGIISNFMFISIADNSDEDVRQEFSKAIDISLSRWDELNAIRGEYMMENAELEERLRKCLHIDNSAITEYGALINEFFEILYKHYNTKFDKGIKKKWLKLKEKRNALGHVKETCDENGYFIESLDHTVKIYENEVDSERIELIESIADIYKYLTLNESNVNYRKSKLKRVKVR